MQRPRGSLSQQGQEGSWGAWPTGQVASWGRKGGQPQWSLAHMPDQSQFSEPDLSEKEQDPVIPKQVVQPVFPLRVRRGAVDALLGHSPLWDLSRDLGSNPSQYQLPGATGPPGPPVHVEHRGQA